jgi:Domain of unknown function DUF29
VDRKTALAILYDQDFVEWTKRNSELLRRGCFAEADIEHLAEEIEDMGKRDQREVRSYLVRLLLHLLKWQAQPEKRSDSWLDSIGQSRVELDGIFDQSPSLEPFARRTLPTAYRLAVKQASRETGLAPQTFPEACPFRYEQVLDLDFLPNNETGQ